jgi:class 3 adenylate cyclase
VCELAAGKRFMFDDRGEHELKGVGEPQRLFAVRGGESS